MIRLTYKYDGQDLYINPKNIVAVFSDIDDGDTVVTTTIGDKYCVTETVEQVVSLIEEKLVY